MRGSACYVVAMRKTTNKKPTSNKAPTPVASPKETVVALLNRSRRAAVPLRKTFLQRKRGRTSAAGPLAQFITNGDERGLDLFLLTVAMSSAEPWSVTEAAQLWARALRHSGRDATSASLSKLWSRLEDRKLITRSRDGRRVVVTLMKEDASGESYSHPGKAPADPYLKLPHAYWTEDWCQVLSLPAKAMLLVALSLPAGFVMPAEKMPAWYGLSADTAQRGLNELIKHELIGYDSRRKAAPLAPHGFTSERRYTLKGAFRLAPGTAP